MACSDNELIIYADGVPLSRSRKDVGCKGEKRLFTSSTTLTGDVSYAWSLDKLTNVVSTNSFYSHKYDTKKHKLYLVVNGDGCGIQLTVDLAGKECTYCPITCYVSTAAIPAREINSLIDENGKIYPLEGGITGQCAHGSLLNIMAGKAIVRAILAGLKCSKGNLNASVYNNLPTKTCLTVTISNSPVKFKYIQVDGVNYLMDNSRCTL